MNFWKKGFVLLDKISSTWLTLCHQLNHIVNIWMTDKRMRTLLRSKRKPSSHWEIPKSILHRRKWNEVIYDSLLLFQRGYSYIDLKSVNDYNTIVKIQPTRSIEATRPCRWSTEDYVSQLVFSQSFLHDRSVVVLLKLCNTLHNTSKWIGSYEWFGQKNQ